MHKKERGALCENGIAYWFQNPYQHGNICKFTNDYTTLVHLLRASHNVSSVRYIFLTYVPEERKLGTIRILKTTPDQ
jgi:hypothetical protein